MAKLVLRELREAQGITLEDLAHKSRISTSQLSRIERDKRDAKVPDLLRFAEQLKVPVGGLFGERSPTLVPILSWLNAGELADPSTQTPAQGVPLLALSDLGPGDYFALKVESDIMDRISPGGSVIVIDRDQRVLQAGKPYVFVVRGEAFYRLWQPKPPRLEPYSTNPAYSAIFVDRQNELEVIGRVRRTILEM